VVISLLYQKNRYVSSTVGLIDFLVAVSLL